MIGFYFMKYGWIYKFKTQKYKAFSNIEKFNSYNKIIGLFKKFPKYNYFCNKTAAFVKSVVRGIWESIIIYDVHVLDFEIESCNAFKKTLFRYLYQKSK